MNECEAYASHSFIFSILLSWQTARAGSLPAKVLFDNHAKLKVVDPAQQG